MSLRFVLGRTGTGKSEYIRDYCLKEAKINPDTEYIIMVPEQFNLQTQMNYVVNSPYGGILNIDVLSFNRLAYRVFGEVGGFNTKVLDESGKLMLLSKVVSNVKKDLSLLGKTFKSLDSVKQLKSILSEFEQYRISEDLINRVINEIEVPGLSNKLREILILQKAFKQYIADNYITKEELMTVLASKISESKSVKKTVFVFDGYTGFTPVQYLVMRELMKYSLDVVVVITMDPALIDSVVLPKHEIFALSVETKTLLTNIANEEKINISNPICLYKNNRHKYDVFSYLEKNIFMVPVVPNNEITDRINVIRTHSPYEEVCLLRSNISRLIRTKGYSYSDIAVVTGDISLYGRYFEKIMCDADIPYFIDETKKLISNSMLETIRALISIVCEDFSYESVFRFFRSNMSDFSIEEIDILENYIISRGIRSFSSWNKEWDRCVKGQGIEELEEINSLRKRFIDFIRDFLIVWSNKKSNVREKTESLYALLVKIDVQKKTENLKNIFEEVGDYVHSDEYSQVYACVINLLNEMVELLGDEYITSDEYLEILDSGFMEAKIGVLPPSDDYVVIGDVERTRFSSIKVLFLLGANDGIIPKITTDDGFLNGSERLELNEKKIVLAPSVRDGFYTQKYYLYRMLCKAEEELFISYSETDSSGESLKPSYLVNTIVEMFPNLNRIVSDSSFKDIGFIESKADAYNYIIENSESRDELWEKLYHYLINDVNYSYNVFMLQQGGLYRSDNLSIGERLARQLYLDFGEQSLSTSITRLELYMSCPFEHYIKYGLRLQERDIPNLQAIDYGTIFHMALEKYINILNSMGISVVDVSTEVMNELSKRCITESYEINYKSFGNPSNRDKYHIIRMTRLMNRTVWAIKRHFEDNLYNISDVEMKFSKSENVVEYILDDNNKMYLNGKIDRIDTYNINDKEYISIVDYKSGNTEFSLLKLFYGLQLQLILYLDAAMKIKKHDEINKSVKPGGLFYYHIADPLIDISNKKKLDNIDEEILKKLKLDGISVEYGKDNIKNPFDENIINKIMKFSVDQAKDAGRNIILGDADINPYEFDNDNNACNYCEYSSICGFDKSLPWCKSRKLTKYPESNILQIIDEKEPSDELD